MKTNTSEAGIVQIQEPTSTNSRSQVGPPAAAEAVRGDASRWDVAVYRQVFEQSPHATFVVDASSQALLAANQAAVRQYGYSVEEFAAMRFSDLAAGGGAPVDPAGTGIQPEGARHRTRDGVLLDVEVKVSSVRVSGREVWVAAVHDVTERKRSERALAEDRHMLDTLLNHCPDRIYFKDRESRFLRCSQAVIAPLGIRDASEALGKTDFDFFKDEHARSAFADEQRILATGEPIVGKIEKEVWANGSVTWALTTKLPYRDPQGEVMGTFGLTKDVTPLKEAEAKLDQMHKQLVDASRRAGMADVATDILHNVGNVLNSVNVSINLIRDGLRRPTVANLAKATRIFGEHQHDLAAFLTSDPKGQVLPGYLQTTAERLETEQAALFEEVQLLNRNIEHVKEIVAMQQSYAKVSGVVETLTIKDLVEDAVRLNEAALTRHGVTVVRQYDEVPLISIDKHRALQIVFNLIRNAKYALDESARPDKRLVLRVARVDPDRVQIAVSDNGIGIPEENLTRIFSHGFTTRKDGHGFGLHSGALAAKELGGSLSVRSDGPGLGATFVLELPLKQPGNVR